MLPYFDANDSIARRTGGSDEHVLAAIAGRFAGAHPKLPVVYRLHTERGFRREQDYRYDMDLQALWPDMEDGQAVYVWGKIWSDQETVMPFSLSCYGPTKVFVNGSAAFASNLNDDVFPDRRVYFRSPIRKGWNHLVLEFVKTGTGCGGKFGTGSIKGFPLHVLAPSPELSGMEGWCCSGPQAGKWPEEQLLSASVDGLADAAIWHPQLAVRPEEAAFGRLGALFAGAEAGMAAYAWTKLMNRRIDSGKVRLQGSHDGPCSLYLNGVRIYQSGAASGSFVVEVDGLPFGSSDLLVQTVKSGIKWDLELEVAAPARQQDMRDEAIALVEPYPVEGLREPWLYLGPFPAGEAPAPDELGRMDRVYGEGEYRTFWRGGQPGTWVRPYLENAMFGKWNYPLGVTLYGIMRTGELLDDPHYIHYAAEHIEQCTALHDYSLWDGNKFGSPGTNHQLSFIDSLDDCGSFGAVMLEACKHRPLEGAAQAAAHIALYISRKQDRLEDGALYRVRGTTDFMADTMWCDDLYMSTPFLCKYYERTGETAYLDDAAQQFLLYRKRLFMPEHQIMHHVYDLKFGKPNGVAWGRGNGWVLFSLTELLAVMPHTHRLYPPILAFFRELCEGYLRLQGANGLWHQVLTDPESYEEASCTSMFVYAFARGVRFGWLEEPEPYAAAVLRGWEGLKAHCIDKHGNVYGVCRGSGYSYSRYYYKDELTWQLNDTHGIGIVLLAGTETIRLRQHINAQKSPQAGLAAN
ncbi:glycoside hydrolase family 88/105 protein [Paenibacillus protaetiae]|uniref:Glycosyl hydrolase n=1 Tax=Paenibacillus protaetiae TaxID=2509456 RepID=A0A4P6EQE5_9BACL|nr:glycoside hydrolase family 88 protein [Paenibacillus protaetiae]QAY65054.1 hypothetical protein ET464_00290 [Paenibacillus protaetiae]